MILCIEYMGYHAWFKHKYTEIEWFVFLSSMKEIKKTNNGVMEILRVTKVKHLVN